MKRRCSENRAGNFPALNILAAILKPPPKVFRNTGRNFPGRTTLKQYLWRKKPPLILFLCYSLFEVEVPSAANVWDILRRKIVSAKALGPSFAAETSVTNNVHLLQRICFRRKKSCSIFCSGFVSVAKNPKPFCTIFLFL